MASALMTRPPAARHPHRERGLAARGRACDEDRLSLLHVIPPARCRSPRSLVSRPSWPVKGGARLGRRGSPPWRPSFRRPARRTGSTPATPSTSPSRPTLPPCPVLSADLREILAAADADAVLQPVAGRRKRLLLADMDSTMNPAGMHRRARRFRRPENRGGGDHRARDAGRDRFRARPAGTRGAACAAFPSRRSTGCWPSASR